MSHLKMSGKDRLTHAQAAFPSDHQYLAKKATGGSSGKKGTRYEDYFAAFLLAELLTEKCWDSTAPNWPEIYEQVVAFVDDVVSSSTDGVTYHQLKNSPSVGWNGTGNTIKRDFELQKLLSQSFGEMHPRTVLVVPGEVQAVTLAQKMPAQISAHSSVRFFPYCEGSLNRLVMEFPPLRDALMRLARVHPTKGKASDDELAYTFGALVQSFFHREPTDMSVGELLRCARLTSPSLVRLLPHEVARVALRQDFQQVLANIDNFSYFTDTGFFAWECLADSGVLTYNCLDSRFLKFQQKVVEMRPGTFEELESFLL